MTRQRPPFRLRPSHAVVAALVAACACAPAGADDGRFTPLVPVESGADSALPAAPERAYEGLADVRLEVDRNPVPADGQSVVRLRVVLVGRDGAVLDAPLPVTVETSAGHVRRADRLEDATQGAQRAALDRIVPGVTARAEGGAAHFELVAPAVPADAVVRVHVGPRTVVGEINFVPELRDMIATGVIEGIVAANSSSVAGVNQDQLENELSHFQRSFDDGKEAVGARSEFFLKGVISGQYLLTLSYDSDRATASPYFRDIRPEEFYPVFGDASEKGFDAQSTHKLYVRVDHDHSFVMYGDFNTSNNPVAASTLGNYSRTLTGLDGHLETSHMVVEAYAARGDSQQVIDEQPSRGTSGPYYVSNLNGLRNSEKVELVTRDRNQPAVILNVQLMTRFVDYTFDPFAGQVLFMQPVPTVDANFNPITIRITYEVDGGGPNYTVFGGSAQVKLNDALAVGGTYAEDQNPANLYRLESVNSTFKLDDTTSVLGEFAHSALNQSLAPVLSAPYSPVESGSGERVAIRHADGPLDIAIDAGRTDIGFYNPSATLQGGRVEADAKASYQVDPDLKLAVELLDSEDRTSGADRTGGQVYADYRLSDFLSLEAGVRRSNDHLGQIDGQPVAVNAYAAGITNTPIGQSYVPYAANSPQLQNAPGLVDSTSLRLKLTAHLSSAGSVFVEVERDVEDAAKRRLAVGADYQIADETRLYARHEWSSASSGPYGLAVDGVRDSMTTVGVEQTYMKDGQLFSEYRLRDAEDEKDAITSFGVRNLWTIADGVRVNTSFERQDVLFNSSSAATTGAGSTSAVSALPQSQVLAASPQTVTNSLAASGPGLGSVGALATSTPLSVPYTTGAATVLTGAIELTYDPLWKAAARLELRRDPDYDSILSTLAYSRKVDDDWTLITRNFLNDLNARNDTVANEYDERLQIGAAFRPVANNQVTALVRYELRVAENLSQPDPAREMQNILTTAATYHPSRPWWFGTRLAAERVADNFAGVRSNYTAYLVGGRVVYDIDARWDVGFNENVLLSPQGASRQYATGVEVGYLVDKNLWLSAGYNWVGFASGDLAGEDYTNRGVYLRLRYKFDEDLVHQGEALIGIEPAPATAAPASASAPAAAAAPTAASPPHPGTE